MKIKPLTKEQIIISVDRLTRFKEPEIKYLRVFKEIILSNLVEPKFKKSELDNMSYDKLRDYAVSVINFSLGEESSDLSINKKISDYENSVFKISENAQVLLDNRINYNKINEILPPHSSPLPWGEVKNFSFIKKILLCEGITEEILLPKFAQILGVDFNKTGIHVVSAGGKNQVVKYFYHYAEILKIPIFVLLDNDAKENLEQIKPKLRDFDKIHLVKSGEFEDLLPNSLIEKTLKYETKNISITEISKINEYSSTVEFLTEYFRHRGLHEFKKSDFAQAVKENIKNINDVSNEIKEIFDELYTI